MTEIMRKESAIPLIHRNSLFEFILERALSAVISATTCTDVDSVVAGKISTADLYLVAGYLYFRYVSIRTVYRTAGRENVIKNLQWIQNSYFYRSDVNHLSIFAEILCVRNHLGICKGMSNRKFETVGRSF